jgi:hypothetical protein
VVEFLRGRREAQGDIREVLENWAMAREAQSVWQRQEGAPRCCLLTGGIERTEWNMSLSTLEMIAAGLEVEPSELLQ